MITIEPMCEQHIVQVADLEKVCFSAPWDEGSLSSELHNPLALWLVALEGDRVVGYIGSQTVPPEADMMNLAVLPEYRRCGLGRALVVALLDRLMAQGTTSLTLEVRQSNEAARALYESLGFAQVGLRPNYYVRPREAACILRKEWAL